MVRGDNVFQSGQVKYGEYLCPDSLVGDIEE